LPLHYVFLSSFFLTAPPTPEISTLSLHDALPISTASIMTLAWPSSSDITPVSWDSRSLARCDFSSRLSLPAVSGSRLSSKNSVRSEEHTSELQSRFDLVCRLLLEKKKERQS